MKRKLTGKWFSCIHCGISVYRKLSLALKIETGKCYVYCGKRCLAENYKIRFKGKNNPAYGKVYRTKKTHPEWANKISIGLIKNEVNVGDKNGMKNPDVAARMSKTRRERVTSNSQYRKERSEWCRQAWANGKYDGVATGRCKWYEHVKPDGTIVKLQGTWEVVYARYLDAKGIAYDAHRGRIPYEDQHNVTRSYYPDFYLIDTDAYVDVKGALFYENSKQKFENVTRSNPDLKLIVITKEDFTKIGIDVITEGNLIR